MTLWLLWPKSLADEAETALLSSLEGNGARLLRYIYPDEVRQFGWTNAKLNTFLQEFVRSPYAAPRRRSVKEKYVNGTPPRQGFCLYEFERPNASIGYLCVLVEQTADGPRMSTSHLLYQCWTDRYYRQHPSEARNAANDQKAAILGYEADRLKLSSLGIPGVFNSDTFQTIPWEDWHRGMLSRKDVVDASGLVPTLPH